MEDEGGKEVESESEAGKWTPLAQWHVPLSLSPSTPRKVASLVGLAPTRTGLKDRALGLLCIQRRLGKWGA